MEIRTEDLEGQTHFVVPMVMIREGVWSGSAGPLLYTENVLRSSVDQWNGKPIVVYHPNMYTSQTAGNPTIFNEQKIGVIFNARMKGSRLTAEAWINLDRCFEVDQRVWNAVRQRQVMEVSTGLLSDEDPTSGIWQGQDYKATVTRIVPDHLAVLPDMRGACSIADGAGLVRNNHELFTPIEV